ncbi:hypothetical protein LNP74_32670 [Klebsiella pneumoniae subsp. pneumoniae]|nr:hypothetical protein [Klebsiella pneumoniae subsp. pneumoniae]
MIATDSVILPPSDDALRRRQIIASAAPGRPNIMIGEEADIEHPRVLRRWREAVDVAVEHSASGVSELTNLEPGDGVQHLSADRLGSADG